MTVDEIATRVENLEERIDTVTHVLIQTLDDPWARGILRSIHREE